MSRDYRLFLEDILESCTRIERYTHEMSFDQFVKDDKTYDAVLRNLEIIGEAVKKPARRNTPSLSADRMA